MTRARALEICFGLISPYTASQMADPAGMRMVEGLDAHPRWARGQREEAALLRPLEL